MLKVLINKLKALLNKTSTEVPVEHVVDDVYITLFQTNKIYPNGDTQIEMYYRGILVEKMANEWSVNVLVDDILSARYDYKLEDKDTASKIRSIFNIRHNRSIEVSVDETTTVRFIFNFFINEKQMKKFHEKINPFANNPAAQTFIGNM